MRQFADEAGLVEAVTKFRKGRPQVSTCVKNKQATPIDGLWVTPSLTIERAGYCGIEEKISSDHMALWIDCSITELLGKEDKTAHPCIRSLLNKKDYKGKKQYISKTEKTQKEMSCLKELRELNEIPKGQWSSQHKEKYNRLLQHDIQQRRYIAATTRKKFTGTRVWSPSLQSLRDQRRLWSLIIKRRSGHVVKTNAICRLMKQTKQADALKMTKEDAQERRKRVDKEYAKTDAEWEEIRYNFVKEMDRLKSVEQGTCRRSKTKTWASIERQRKIGRLIAKLKGRKRVKISNRITRDEQGRIQDLKTSHEMEKACIISNIKRFSQAN